MERKLRKRLFTPLFVITVASASLTAQNVILTGALSGRATDQSGAMAPRVLVAVRNVDTGVEQTTETNNTGLYRFPSLAPGTYSLSASLKGFRDAEGLVQVRVGNVTLQDIRLQLGAGKDTVDVTGTAPLLHPAEVSIDSVLEQPLIEELPLNGRRYTDFTLLTPNTNPDGDTGLISIAGQQGGEDSGYANGSGSKHLLSTGPTPPVTTLATFWAAIGFHTFTVKTPSRSFRSQSVLTRPCMGVGLALSIR